MDKNQLSQMFNMMSQFLSPAEMTKVMTAQTKDFDGAWDIFTDISKNNTKLPAEVKMIFTDPEIAPKVKAMLKDAIENSSSEQEVMQKAMVISQKLQQMIMERRNNPASPSNPSITPKTPSITPNPSITPKTPVPTPKRRGGGNGPVF